MCAICVQFEQEKLTIWEAKAALKEMINTEQLDLEHSLEVADKIHKKEQELKDMFSLSNQIGVIKRKV